MESKEAPAMGSIRLDVSLPSGESVSVNLPPSAAVLELKEEASSFETKASTAF